MFSTTTMASSTTNPTAMVSPISEMLSRLKLSMNIAANEPSSASGTVMLGMKVAQKKEHDHHDEADRQYQGKLNVVDRRANRHGAVEQGLDFHRRRYICRELQELRLDEFDGVNDVGAGQLLDAQQHARLVVGKARNVAARRLNDSLADI